MDNRPLVSVVIPAYNRAGSIRAALQSVQRQTHEDWEAIVVDDGSHDDTPELVEQLAREDSRIRLIRHEANRGAQAARNTAIHAARGAWIAFLDSDDQFLPHSLESRFELATEQKVSVVHSNCYMIGTGDSPRLHEVRPLAGSVYRPLLQGEGPVFPGLLVHKEALKRINYLDERIVSFQEWDTTIRLAAYYPFGFEVTPTFIWDCRNTDTISRNMRGNGKGYEQVLHKHYMAILRHAGPHALARHYRVAATWYQRGHDQRAVRRCLLMSLIWSSVDVGRVLRKLGQLLVALAPRRSAPEFKQQSPIDATELRAQLSDVLNVHIEAIKAHFLGGHSGRVHRIEFSGGFDNRRNVIVKKVDDSFQYRFYKSVLEPLELDSPRMHGNIRTKDGLFLVMEHIPSRTSPADEDTFIRAADWLVKKDTIAYNNLDFIKRSGLLSFSLDRPPFVSRIDECLDILRAGVKSKSNLSPLLSRHFLHALIGKKEILYQLADNVFRKSRLTVCHHDFHRENILFSQKDRKLYIIDWTHPAINSVCIDLVGLIHSAPQALRPKLIAAYRAQIDFEGFESIYEQSEVLVSLSDFSWMFSVIIDGRKQLMSPRELQTARRLQNYLFSALKLGLD